MVEWRKLPIRASTGLFTQTSVNARCFRIRTKEINDVTCTLHADDRYIAYAYRRQTEDFDIVALSSSWVSDSIGVVIGIPRFVRVSEENATT